VKHLSCSFKGVACAFGLATALIASSAQATDAIDPQARAILDRARSIVLNAQAFSVDITHVQLLTSPGFKMEIEGTIELAAQRPTKIDLVAKCGELQGRLMSDGTTLIAHSDGRYTQKPAPPQIHEIADELDGDAHFLPRETKLIFSLLFTDRFPDDFATLTASSVVGDEEIDGMPVTRLRLTLEPKPIPQEQVNAPRVEPSVLLPELSKLVLDVWIDRGERPLVRKFYADMTPFLQGFSKPKDGSTQHVTFSLNHWKLDDPIAPERFTFSPPEGSREVVSHISPGTQWPLVGNPPAAMDLPILGGGRFNPTNHKGNVMVMVYWRLKHDAELYWLTDVVKAAAGFADQGVVLFTINVGDSEEHIRQFLTDRGWQAPVALGHSETVPQDIAISSVPYILVVGQDGIVQGMHYMADRSTSSRLKAQLRWLLRGKSLLQDGDESPDLRPPP